MPLFSKNPSIPRPVRVKYVPVPVVQEYLPALYRNLACFCTRHGMPVPLRFAGFGKTVKGDPCANYRCPLCSREEVYVKDFTTQKPRMLFSRG